MNRYRPNALEAVIPGLFTSENTSLGLHLFYAALEGLHVSTTLPPRCGVGRLSCVAGEAWDELDDRPVVGWRESKDRSRKVQP